MKDRKGTAQPQRRLPAPGTPAGPMPVQCGCVVCCSDPLDAPWLLAAAQQCWASSDPPLLPIPPSLSIQINKPSEAPPRPWLVSMESRGMRLEGSVKRQGSARWWAGLGVKIFFAKNLGGQLSSAPDIRRGRWQCQQDNQEENTTTSW